MWTAETDKQGESCTIGYSRKIEERSLVDGESSDQPTKIPI